MSVFFLDFDNTLFDTKGAFKTDLFSIFEKYGASRKIILDAYHFFMDFGMNVPLSYTPEKHIDAICLKNPNISLEQKHAMNREVKDMLAGDLSKYLLDDARKFLPVFLKKSPIILSYGDKNFQMNKIVGARLHEFIPDIIIASQDKAKVAKRSLFFNQKETMILIDDVPKYFPNWKKCFSDSVTVHIRKTQETCAGFCDIEAKGFEEVVYQLDLKGCFRQKSENMLK